MGRRIGAYLVDIVIMLLIGGVMFAATASGETIEGVDVCDDLSTLDSSSETSTSFCTFEDGFVISNGEDSTYIETGSTYATQGVVLAYALIVFVVLQGITGATPGKLLFGVRTVNEDGEAPGIGRAFVRWILWIVDAFPWCCFIPVVGGIAAFTSRGHRRVGDMAAKTYVVDKDDMGAPIHIGAAQRYQPTSGATTATTWAPPAGPPAGSPGATPAAAPATESGSEPVWDPQRNKYVKWDAPSGQWLEYDDDAGDWRPLSS